MDKIILQQFFILILN